MPERRMGMSWMFPGRDSVEEEAARELHRKMYRPDNRLVVFRCNSVDCRNAWLTLNADEARRLGTELLLASLADPESTIQVQISGHVHADKARRSKYKQDEAPEEERL